MSAAGRDAATPKGSHGNGWNGNGSNVNARSRPAAGAPHVVAWGGGPLLDLHDVRAGVSRYRRLWAGIVLLGLCVGAAISIVLPRPYTATTTLLLGHPKGGDPAKTIETDTSLLKANEVVRGAMKQLGVHESAGSFSSRFSGAVVSDDLVALKTTASSAAEATRFGGRDRTAVPRIPPACVREAARCSGRGLRGPEGDAPS